MLRPILCCLLVASMCLAGCTSTEDLNENAELPEGSVPARTTQPDVPDAKGLGATERAKYNKNLKSY